MNKIYNYATMKLVMVMEERKYILTEEDVRKLSVNDRYTYDKFMYRVYNDGVIYEHELSEYNDLLYKQYRSRNLFNPNGLERYPEILSKNLQIVLDAVIKVRNDIINEKRVFNPYHFSNLAEGLEKLIKFVEKNILQYRGSFGISELEELLKKINQLKNQVSIDIKFYSDYHDKKMKAKFDYEHKKEQYDSLSLFGKIVSLINGKKKELEEASIKASDYYSVKLDRGEKSDIINPWKYEQYIEEHQEEQTIGGKNR